MHTLDYALIVAYLALLLFLGMRKRLSRSSSAADLIVGGRTLTLPAFVASLVSTWYGGILGVGEFSYAHGLSTWLVFGLPYYLAAALFAFFLAKKARQSEVLTIPERLAQTYGNRTATFGAVIIFFMTVPAAYVLMLGVLCEYLFGWPFWIGVVGGTLFSIVYVYLGGFASVVRTDLFQFGLMFVGFAVLLVMLLAENGGISFIESQVPSEMLTWHGGNTGWYIATWYFIALATLIEPAFYQRCYAAKSASTARNGIFISIACWALFDFMTTSCGLYARALLPELADPISSYPALAALVLPTGLLGLFALSLLATVMSTVDSYSFLAASTFGRDIIERTFHRENRQATALYTRIGLIVSVGLAVVLALYFKSVVEIWYVFGSIGTPALLAPVFFSHVGRRRFTAASAPVSIVLTGGVSLLWYASQFWTTDGSYWLGLQPIFPGLALSLLIWTVWGTRADDSSTSSAYRTEGE